MDLDLLLLMGLLFIPLGFVAFVSAWADRRRPWAALILFAMAAGLIWWVFTNYPGGGFDWRQIPNIAVETVARYWPQ